MPNFDSELLRAAVLLLPVIGIGVAFLIKRPTFFEAVGMMLGILLNVAYVLLFNILAEAMGWWVYLPTDNAYYGIPIDIILGWSFFWGGFLPYVFRSRNSVIPIACALMIDLWLMPVMTSVFTLGEYWLLGEVLLLLTCLLPSLLIFQYTANRKHVMVRAFIQSFIWGGWIVFIVPSIALFMEGKNIFSFFDMAYINASAFLTGLCVSFIVGYAALIEFARVGGGTPIPFDPPKTLVTSGIYSHIANPLQVSTLLIFLCFLTVYQSWMMIIPISSLLIYSEIFVRWHHSVDIAQRFGDDWLLYRAHVKNWIPRSRPYSSD